MKAKLKPSNLLIYEESLVCIDNKGIEDFKPEGDYEKKILIITDDISTGSEEQILLDKMLSAIGLKLKDIYLLKLQNKKGLLSYINKQRPEKIICFGAQMDTVATVFSNRLYKIQIINDYQLVIANNLSQIITSSDAKQALWNSLKKMFNL